MLSLAWNFPCTPLFKQCAPTETWGKYLFPLDPIALHYTTTGSPAETARAAISGQVSSEEKGQSEEPLW